MISGSNSKNSIPAAPSAVPGVREPGRTVSGAPVRPWPPAADDRWVAAVCAALARERTWRMGRRPSLLVKEGSGEMFHVTATENRQSILRHGLDWRQMGTIAGIAGSREPELPAVFLCENRDEIGFFTEMSRLPADVWAVRVDGLWVETGPHGWIIVPEP